MVYSYLLLIIDGIDGEGVAWFFIMKRERWELCLLP